MIEKEYMEFGKLKKYESAVKCLQDLADRFAEELENFDGILNEKVLQNIIPIVVDGAAGRMFAPQLSHGGFWLRQLALPAAGREGHQSLRSAWGQAAHGCRPENQEQG